MGEPDQLIQLRCHYLFSAFSARQWQAFLPHLSLRDLESDTDLLLTPDQGAFYILLDGMIKLYRVTGHNEKRIARIVRTGQSFADDALFSDEPGGLVMAHALCPSVVASIGHHAYLDLLRKSLDISRAVMMRMVESKDAYSNELERLHLSSSLARIAHYLLHLAADTNNKVLNLPSSKCAIARQLGLAPETLSRTLRTLIDQNLISVDGSIVSIRNSSALDEIANISRSASPIDEEWESRSISSNECVSTS